jgi:hypothetical protein
LTHKGIKAALGNITDKVEALDLSKNLIDFQGCLGIESVLSEQNLKYTTKLFYGLVFNTYLLRIQESMMLVDTIY